MVRPPWAEVLANKYVSGQSSMFLLHGCVDDQFQWELDNKPTWLSLQKTLESMLLPKKDIVVIYDITSGFRFPNKQHEKAFIDIIQSRRKLRNEDPKIDTLPKAVAKALPLIEDIITCQSVSSAIIINYIEGVAPAGDIASLTEVQTTGLLTLHRWATDNAILDTDNLIIMVAESLSEVNRKLVSATSVAPIHVDFPDLATRKRFIETFSWEKKPNYKIDVQALARITAGLKLMQISHILRASSISGEAIGFETVTNHKKAIIEQECSGLVELIPPRYRFEHVGGMEGTKASLLRVAADIKADHTARIPMGMIFTGPMGSGKTFVAEAFATESGLTCLKLKNFRDKWVGSTEANLEKVLGLVEALGNVLLVIDEADRGLSSGGSDDAVGSRVIAKLKEFMSNTAHRGHVIILMMTNRPDKLDVDLKRPGRFDTKIPFFFPESPEEREAIFRAVCKKNRIEIARNLSLAYASSKTDNYSSAELEQIVLTAIAKLDPGEPDVLTQAHLNAAVDEIIPSRDTDMLAYMELLAVFECSSKTMLPKRYQDLTPEQVRNQLTLLKLKLLDRV